MKKLNNKGFAISTILYGLLIVLILITTLIMSTMSFSRKNGKEFTEQIVNELEKRKRVTKNIKNYCIGEAVSYTNRGGTCDDVIAHVQQKVAQAHGGTINPTQLTEITDHLEIPCHYGTSTVEGTARKSCCYYRSGGLGGTYSSCIS